jgi:hypothetical protein
MQPQEKTNRKHDKDELIAILWKLKNAAATSQPRAVDFGKLLHDQNFRSDFIERAANSSYSEIRHAALRARELDARCSLR